MLTGVHIGEMLPHRVDLLAVDETATDASGGLAESESPLQTEIAAFVTPAKASVVDRYARLQKRVTHTIYVRDNHLDFAGPRQLRFGVRIFKVVGVLNHGEADKVIEISAEEWETEQ